MKKKPRVVNDLVGDWTPCKWVDDMGDTWERRKGCWELKEADDGVWRTTGLLPDEYYGPYTEVLEPNHSGVFKYWPQVHEMWRTRTYGTKVIRTIDFEQPQWDQRASSFEMRRFCGRR